VNGGDRHWSLVIGHWSLVLCKGLGTKPLRLNRKSQADIAAKLAGIFRPTAAATGCK